MIDVLSRSTKSKENQIAALTTFETLFKLKSVNAYDPESEGQMYRDNFVAKNGLDILEDLQEDGCHEIYELANKIMFEYFQDYLEEDENLEEAENV